MLVLHVASCKKLVEIESPSNSIIGREIYATATTANSVIRGIYTQMVGAGIFNGDNSLSITTALSADDLMPATSPDHILSILYNNGLTNQGHALPWSPLYNFVFKANAAIEGIAASSGITDPVKKQLVAEAKFIRAFMYFYLVNLYGDVPLVISTDPTTSSIASRVSQQLVYDQIIADLTDAQSDLNINYVGADGLSEINTRVRPNKAAATALLARAYLYTGQWELAEVESSKIIDDANFELEPLNEVFLMTSREALWQLQPNTILLNTLDATAMVLLPGGASVNPGPSDSKPVFMSPQLFNAFDINDQRKEIWIDSVAADNIIYPFAYKYKAYLFGAPRTEYLVVLRLAEQFLIRAEARAHLGKVSGAASASTDINAIRSRAGLADIDLSDFDNPLNEIYSERRKELFTEFGHRWFDLKRTGTINEVMTPLQKGSGWEPYKALYPIPVQDIQRNPSLRGKQNPGYPEF
jgi:hypothetical protein